MGLPVTQKLQTELTLVKPAMHRQPPVALSYSSKLEQMLTHLLEASWNPGRQTQRLSVIENYWLSRQAEEALMAGVLVEGAAVWKGLPKDTSGTQLLERLT